jgi:hypothetical protein
MGREGEGELRRRGAGERLEARSQRLENAWEVVTFSDDEVPYR